MSEGEGRVPSRRITVVVDNPSWIVPYARRLVERLRAAGHDADFASAYGDVRQGDIAFLLGCISLAPVDILARNARNLVVHESDLPHGRGFSPLTWQVLEGRRLIPVCLLEAGEGPDTGPVVYRAEMVFEGHELIDEMRERLGELTTDLCLRFAGETTLPAGVPQEGEGSLYPRRRPADSRLDPEKSLAAQFDLLRVVDNERYPAFFDWRGHRYQIAITKLDAAP